MGEIISQKPPSGSPLIDVKRDQSRSDVVELLEAALGDLGDFLPLEFGPSYISTRTGFL